MCVEKNTVDKIYNYNVSVLVFPIAAHTHVIHEQVYMGYKYQPQMNVPNNTNVCVSKCKVPTLD